MKNLGFHWNYNYFSILTFFKEFLFFQKTFVFFREILKLQKSPVCLSRSSRFSKIRHCSHKTLLILQNIQFVFAQTIFFRKTHIFFREKALFFQKIAAFNGNSNFLKILVFFLRNLIYFTKLTVFLTKPLYFQKPTVCNITQFFLFFTKQSFFEKTFFFKRTFFFFLENYRFLIKIISFNKPHIFFS